MARTLISSPSFIGTPLPSIYRHGLFHRRLVCTRVKLSFHEIPPIHFMDSSIDFNAIVRKAEGLLYTLADAAVAVDSASGAADAAVPLKNGGWFGFISDGMEIVLKVLKDGLSAVHVPYAYGFAIILLTVIVKAATYPLTKQQVESTMAMQNVQPKIKAIQQRYAGNQERVQLETSRLYRRAEVNPLAGGAKPVVNENSGIVTAGRAKSSASQPVVPGNRQLKDEEKRENLSKALPVEEIQAVDSLSDSGVDSDEDKDKDEALEEAYASSASKQVPNVSPSTRSKRSKRKRAV